MSSRMAAVFILFALTLAAPAAEPPGYFAIHVEKQRG